MLFTVPAFVQFSFGLYHASDTELASFSVVDSHEVGSTVEVVREFRAPFLNCLRLSYMLLPFVLVSGMSVAAAWVWVHTSEHRDGGHVDDAGNTLAQNVFVTLATMTILTLLLGTALRCRRLGHQFEYIGQYLYESAVDLRRRDGQSFTVRKQASDAAESTRVEIRAASARRRACEECQRSEKLVEKRASSTRAASGVVGAQMEEDEEDEDQRV